MGTTATITLTDWITIAGAAITVTAMTVSIVQARRAAASNRDIRSAMARVELIGIAERLRAAQEYIRSLPTDLTSLRGYDSKANVDRIRREFDNALGALTAEGPERVARESLSDAQENLNRYATSLGVQIDVQAWQALQTQVQNAISELTAAAVRLESRV